MKRSRFNEEQIIAVLKEQEAGMPTAEVCRRHGISSATFYKWKSKFGGLEVSDARRLRMLRPDPAQFAFGLQDSALTSGFWEEGGGAGDRPSRSALAQPDIAAIP